MCIRDQSGARRCAWRRMRLLRERSCQRMGIRLQGLYCRSHFLGRTKKMLTDLSTPSLVMAKALVDNHVPQAVALAKRILEEHAPMEFNDYKINWVDAAKELPLMSEPFAPPLSIALWMDDSRKRQVSNVVLTICAGRVIPA